jgi:hypothetical protein
MAGSRVQKHRWVQPFRWGILLAFDDQAEWELPAASPSNAVAASPTCLTVPVLHAQDIDTPEDVDPDGLLPEAQVTVTVIVSDVVESAAEFVGVLSCPSGLLRFGDAENGRVIVVPAGQLRVSVTREPVEFAEQVTIQVLWVG